MKASEIVNKLKDVLLSSTEKEEETTPQVELKEEAPKANKANKEEAKPKTAKAEVRQINYSADEKLAEEIDEDEEVGGESQDEGDGDSGGKKKLIIIIVLRFKVLKLLGFFVSIPICLLLHLS